MPQEIFYTIMEDSVEGFGSHLERSVNASDINEASKDYVGIHLTSNPSGEIGKGLSEHATTALMERAGTGCFMPLSILF